MIEIIPPPSPVRMKELALEEKEDPDTKDNDEIEYKSN